MAPYVTIVPSGRDQVQALVEDGAADGVEDRVDAIGGQCADLVRPVRVGQVDGFGAELADEVEPVRRRTPYR